MEQYSVLMAVYYKEKPDNLRLAIQSVVGQTVMANEIVIVCDGPLTEELDNVLEEFCARYPTLFQIIRLEKNGGLGNALRIGITQCTNELIARMDSDDISVPDRMEKQLSVFEDMPWVGLVSGQIEEFDDDTGEAVAIREVPLRHEEIVKIAKHRCPVNHVACMYRKSEVVRVGSYRSVSHEDYDLWVRMIENGTVFANHPDVLVHVRVGKSMYGRRGGWTYFKGAKQLEKCMLASGFITRGQYCCNVFTRFVSAVMPSGMRGWLYKKLMRKPPRETEKQTSQREPAVR